MPFLARSSRCGSGRSRLAPSKWSAASFAASAITAMKGTLVVDTPAEYQAWLKERVELSGNQSAPPALQRPPGEPPVGPTPGHRRRPRALRRQPTRAADKKGGPASAPESAREPMRTPAAETNPLPPSLCLVHGGGDALAHLQRRDGDKQRGRSRCARLADDLRLQHVFLSGLEMGRRNFLRTHSPLDRVGHRIFDHHSGGLACVFESRIAGSRFSAGHR